MPRQSFQHLTFFFLKFHTSSRDVRISRDKSPLLLRDLAPPPGQPNGDYDILSFSALFNGRGSHWWTPRRFRVSFKPTVTPRLFYHPTTSSIFFPMLSDRCPTLPSLPSPPLPLTDDHIGDIIASRARTLMLREYEI
jgi:hypothetical protein